MDEQLEINLSELLEHCGFCYDEKAHKNIELYYIDRANNMRPCVYCPACGRKM